MMFVYYSSLFAILFITFGRYKVNELTDLSVCVPLCNLVYVEAILSKPSKSSKGAIVTEPCQKWYVSF